FHPAIKGGATHLKDEGVRAKLLLGLADGVRHSRGTKRLTHASPTPVPCRQRGPARWARSPGRRGWSGWAVSVRLRAAEPAESRPARAGSAGDQGWRPAPSRGRLPSRDAVATQGRARVAARTRWPAGSRPGETTPP